MRKAIIIAASGLILLGIIWYAVADRAKERECRVQCEGPTTPCGNDPDAVKYLHCVSRCLKECNFR